MARKRSPKSKATFDLDKIAAFRVADQIRQAADRAEETSEHRRRLMERTHTR